MIAAPATPTSSKKNRIPCLLIATVYGSLLLCLGIAGIAGTFYLLGDHNSVLPLVRALPTTTPIPLPIPSASTGTASKAPTVATRLPANAPSLSPTAPFPDSWGTYQGAHAPFTVAYPIDWVVDNDNESDGVVVFMSPDQTAAATVIFLKAGPLSIDQAMDRITHQILSKSGSVNVISSNKNADGSITQELEYTSVALGGRVHSFARLLRFSDMYYLAIFDAQSDSSAQFAEIGKKYVESLTVRE